MVIAHLLISLKLIEERKGDQNGMGNIGINILSSLVL